MPKTRQEVDAVWAPLHDKLTRIYYVDKTVDKATFDKLHATIWLLHEKEGLAEGILADYVDEETQKLRSTLVDEILTSLGGETQLKKEVKALLG